MSIKDRALIVNIGIGLPSQHKKLKAPSEQIEVDSKAHKNQVKVVSKLYAKEDMTRITKLSGEARRVFKEMTLPWGRGAGLVPTARYLEFVEIMRQYKAAFETEKQDLVSSLVDIMERAESANGDLFDLSNYPQILEFSDSMYFSYEALPVPAINDYDALSGLTPEEISKLKEEAVLTTTAKTEEAMRDLFSRLFTSLQRAAERLTPNEDGTTKVFRDSLIDNIRTAVEAAETLNIIDDTKLSDLADEAKAVIDSLTANDLRSDINLRVEVATKVDELVDKVGQCL